MSTTLETPSISKRRKPEEEEEENENSDDKISNLPDSILSHILSFVPTKTAVSTSLLSSKWRHIWQQHLSVLDFSDDDFQPNEDDDIFKTLAVFVNSVFILRKPCEIRKMRLSSTSQCLVDDKFCTYSVNTWLRSVFGPHLEELDLQLFAGDAYLFELPFSLSACINLVSLSLVGSIDFDLKSAKVIRLPSLKKLLLDIIYVEVLAMDTFLSGFPILETLDLCFYSVEDNGKFRVPPSLKWLKITRNGDIGEPLDIDVPSLEYLNISGIMFGDVGNLQNVVEASINIFPSPGASAFTLLKLLRTLSRVKHLVLSRSTTQWLLGGPTDLRFPEFSHLLHLELILPWFNSNSLLSLLQTCHLLQDLVIQNDEEQSPLPKWATAPSVPRCLVAHLASVQFKGYRGFPDELLFVEYILQEGLVLKTVIIADISVDLRKKFDTLKRLSNVPRASGMCKLTFD